MGSFVPDDDPPTALMRGDDGKPLQGWYPDPTQRHEERYFSQGAPTKLYRDGATVARTVEGFDDISAYLTSLMDADTGESLEGGASEQTDGSPSRMHHAEASLGVPRVEAWHGTGEPSLLSESRKGALIDPERVTPREHLPSRNVVCGHCGASLLAQEKSQSADGLHWRVVDQPAGSVALEMEIRDDMRDPAGSLEDRLVASLAEVAGISAIGSKVGPVATEHLGVSFLAPGWVGPIRATASAQRVGKEDGIADVRVIDRGKDDQLMAVATVTALILDRS